MKLNLYKSKIQGSLETKTFTKKKTNSCLVLYGVESFLLKAMKEGKYD